MQLHITVIRLGVLLFLLVIISLVFKHHPNTFIFNNNFLLKSNQRLSSNSIPTIARTLYLFLCENQAEIDMYKNAFPSVTADIMFFCWKQNCIDTHFSKLQTFYTIKWSGRPSHSYPFVRLDPAFNYIMIKSRVFIINEHQLNLTERTTWTTARNMLYERALIEEQHQFIRENFKVLKTF